MKDNEINQVYFLAKELAKNLTLGGREASKNIESIQSKIEKHFSHDLLQSDNIIKLDSYRAK